MSTSTQTSASRDGGAARGVPAYGPIEAALGLVLFYVVVDRVTPAVVAVFGTAVPELSPAVVRLGLAFVLWFIVVTTVVEQVRRQLEALGPNPRPRSGTLTRSIRLPAPAWFLVLLVGGVVAAVTAEGALETVGSLVRIVGSVDAAAFPLVDVTELVAFAVSYAVATHALDRLVIGGIRATAPV